MRFAGATPIANATSLTLQVRPATHQPGGHVLQARQLNLQLAFVALGARGEYVQDQAGTVGHGHAQMSFQIALLSRAQGLVEDDAVGARGLDHGFNFIGLAAADEQRRIWRPALGNDA